MKNIKSKKTIRELIEIAKKDNDNYLTKEQKCFNFQRYINFVVKELAEENGLSQSLVFTVIVEKGLEALKDVSFRDVAAERFSK